MTTPLRSRAYQRDEEQLRATVRDVLLTEMHDIAGELARFGRAAPAQPTVVTEQRLQPWMVAGIRGALSAVIGGASVALATASAGGGTREIVIASLSALVSTLALRFGVESAIDQARAKQEPPA